MIHAAIWLISAIVVIWLAIIGGTFLLVLMTQRWFWVALVLLVVGFLALLFPGWVTIIVVGTLVGMAIEEAPKRFPILSKKLF